MKIQKAKYTAIMFLSILLFLSGTSSIAGEKPDRETTLKEVSQEVKEAVKAIEDYSVDQRDEALRKVRIAVNHLDDRIDELNIRVEKKWDQMDKGARDKARALLKSLRKKRNELAQWYGGMEHSSVKAWKHVKKGFLESFETLSEAYGKALKEF